MNNLVQERSILFSLPDVDIITAGWIDDNKIFYCEPTKLYIYSIPKKCVISQFSFQDNILSTKSIPNNFCIYIVTTNNVCLATTNKSTRITYLNLPIRANKLTKILPITDDTFFLIYENGTVYFLDKSKKWAQCFKLQENEITCAEFINASIIAFGTAFGKVGIINIAMDDLFINSFSQSIREHCDQVTNILPIGNNFIATSRDHSLSIWRWEESFSHLKTVNIECRHFLNCISKLDQKFILADAAGYIYPFSLTKRLNQKARKLHEDSIRFIQASPNGQMLMSLADDGLIKIIKTNSFKPITQLGTKREYIRTGIIIASEDNDVVIGTSKGSLIFFSNFSVGCIDNFENGSIRSILYLPKEYLLVGRDSGYLDIFKISSHTIMHSFELEAGIFSIALLTDMNHALIGLRNGKLVRIDLDTWSVIESKKVHDNLIGDIKVFRSHIITCSDDGAIKFSRVNSTQIVRVLYPDELALNNICIENQLALVSSDNGSVILVDLFNQRIISHHRLHEEPIRALGMQGSKLFTGDRKGTIKITNIDTWENLLSLDLGRRIVSFEFVSEKQQIILVITDLGEQ